MAVFLAPACNMERWCATNYPPEEKPPETIITTKDSVIYRDTTVYIHLPGQTDTAYIDVPCQKAYISDTAIAETELAKAWAWMQWRKINLVLIQKDTTITQRLDSAIMEAQHWKEKYTTETKVKVIYEAPGWWRFTHYGFFTLLMLLIIIFIAKTLTK